MGKHRKTRHLVVGLSFQVLKRFGVRKEPLAAEGNLAEKHGDLHQRDLHICGYKKSHCNIKYDIIIINFPFR